MSGKELLERKGIRDRKIEYFTPTYSTAMVSELMEEHAKNYLKEFVDDIGNPKIGTENLSWLATEFNMGIIQNKA